MKLTNSEKKNFVSAFRLITNETPIYEQRAIASILRMPVSKEDWRFPKNIKCSGCGKPTTNFDFFISSIITHGLDFIIAEARLALEDNSSKIDIKIVNHAMSVNCIACGTLCVKFDSSDINCQYAYRYPGVGYKIRISKSLFEKLKMKI